MYASWKLRLEKIERALTAREQHHLEGLQFDSACTVLYGDPAWVARMAPLASRGDYYTMELTEKARSVPESPTVFEVKVTSLRSGNWTPVCPDDKTTLPGRPPFLLHGRRFLGVVPSPCKGPALVLTNLFALMPLEGSFEAGEVFTREFIAFDV